MRSTAQRVNFCSTKPRQRVRSRASQQVGTSSIKQHSHGFLCIPPKHDAKVLVLTTARTRTTVKTLKSSSFATRNSVDGSIAAARQTPARTAPEISQSALGSTSGQGRTELDTRVTTEGSKAERVECDYLVVGAGAMGLAFVDELHARLPRCRIALVDQRGAPGGHWNSAYGFVRLHQPAQCYGVNSRRLEQPHQGTCQLSSKQELLDYFLRVKDALVSSGFVEYFCSCTYSFEDNQGEALEGGGQLHRFQSNDGETLYEVEVKCKLVDASYLTAVVPSMCPPPFPVAPGVDLRPVNALADALGPSNGGQDFMVIGAGKTGMDAVIQLLSAGVPQEDIRWVMPNDSLIFDRDALFTDAPVVAKFNVYPFDPSAREFAPSTSWKCVTLSRAEYQQLRRIKNIIRMGRVEEVSEAEVVLERGCVPVTCSTVLVDCTSNGLTSRAAAPVFAPDRLVLQSVSLCQQVFSASLIAYIETLDWPLAKQNAYATPIPQPRILNPDLARTAMAWTRNLDRWRSDPLIGSWLETSRLYNFHYLSSRGLREVNQLTSLCRLLNLLTSCGVEEEAVAKMASRGVALMLRTWPVNPELLRPV